jgi:hypothetical protein
MPSEIVSVGEEGGESIGVVDRAGADVVRRMGLEIGGPIAVSTLGNGDRRIDDIVGVEDGVCMRWGDEVSE